MNNYCYESTQKKDFFKGKSRSQRNSSNLPRSTDAICLKSPKLTFRCINYFAGKVIKYWPVCQAGIVGYNHSVWWCVAELCVITDKLTKQWNYYNFASRKQLPILKWMCQWQKYHILNENHSDSVVLTCVGCAMDYNPSEIPSLRTQQQTTESTQWINSTGAEWVEHDDTVATMDHHSELP